MEYNILLPYTFLAAVEKKELFLLDTSVYFLISRHSAMFFMGSA